MPNSRVEIYSVSYKNGFLWLAGQVLHILSVSQHLHASFAVRQVISFPLFSFMASRKCVAKPREEKTGSRSSLNLSHQNKSHTVLAGKHRKPGGGCVVNPSAQAVFWLSRRCSGPIRVQACKMDSGPGFFCRAYDASEDRGVEEESGEKAGGFIAFQLWQLSLQSVLNKNLFISRIRPACTTQLDRTQLRNMRWMLLYPAVSWLSDSLVQLESERQDQETPKGRVVTAE